MNCAQRLQMCSYIIKRASPAWVRAIQSGSLSPSSLKRLANILPSSVTRQLSNKPIGSGTEGKIFPSFSGGGVGNSVIKRLHTPNEDKVRKLTSLFSSHKEVFPEVLKVLGGGKGYAMPKYNVSPPTGVLAGVKDLVGLGSGAKWREFLSYLKKNTTSSSSPINLTSRFDGMAPVAKKNMPYGMVMNGHKINDLSRYSNNIMFNNNGKPVIVDPYIS